MSVEFHKIEQDRSIILFDAGIVKESIEGLWLLVDESFPPSALMRGKPCFFVYEGQSFNVRHFRRGGLVEALLQDRYVGQGRKSSRAFAEFHLLAWMRERSLPVPQPVAARVHSGVFFYRADLVTRRIPGANPLSETLQRTNLEACAWHQLGAVIAQFHRAGIFHADLNAGNILIDNKGDFFLIDFDRGVRRSSGRWKNANLERLLRSFSKLHASATGNFHFTPTDWQGLLQGYAEAFNELN